jgi:hypothetical protein
MTTQTNVSRETEKIQNLVKSKIDQLLSNQINYEWNGTDLTNDLTNELWDEKNEKNVTLVHTGQKVMLDYKLYETFVNHLTEVVMSGIEEGEED